MTLTYFNDTGRDIRIHGATKEHGIDCLMTPIRPQELRYFEIPEGKSPFLKLWEYEDGLMLLVSYMTT